MKKYVYFILLFFVVIIIGIVYAARKSSVERKQKLEEWRAFQKQSDEAARRVKAAAEVHLETGSVFEPVVLDIDEDGNIRH